MADPFKRSWRIVHAESSCGWGGQEHRVLTELAGFQERGCDVRLLAPVGSEVFPRAQAAGIPCQPLAGERWQFPFAVINAVAWLRRIRPQVVNTHSSRDGWLVGLAARLARVPFLVRTRHIDVDYPNRWVSRQAYTTLADHVLTTSRKITAHFQEIFHLPDRRISTVPTGIDLDVFLPSGPKADRLAGREAAGKRLVGMVSVLRSWKGHATFLQAARRLLDDGLAAHFVIVGEGPIRRELEAQIEEFKLGNHVALAGHREDVPAVLRALDVLAIPSTRHEGVPQIGLQALACRTPVVGSDVGGIPEIIREGETGRVFPANEAAQLASRIQETLRQPEQTRRMAERGRALVEAEYSDGAMLDKLDAIYRRHLIP
jgi:glycosyltransferase involved in cell wall biosynthesis